jgi:hypothetical protein
MKRMLGTGLALMLLAGFSVGFAGAGVNTKVDVCHLEGNGSFHLINVSDNAFDQHLAHGDWSPGDPVPGMNHYVFDGECGFEFVPFLVETVNVSGTSNAITSSSALVSGVGYELRATGTYRFANWGLAGIADAQCSYRIPPYVPVGYTLDVNGAAWVNGDDLPAGVANWLEVWADGAALDWSPSSCTASNSYSVAYTSSGGAIGFQILDDHYGDNSGSIAVAIWQMTPAP